MASISNDPGGRRRIQFFDTAGKRCTIWLGRTDKKTAASVRERIEKIVNAATYKTSLDDETARWISDANDVLHAKLSGAGLVPPRGTCQLGPWIKGYIAERSDLKPRTIALYTWTGKALTDYFGRDRFVRDITRDEASRWYAQLVTSKLAIASVRLHVMTAKTLIGAAVKRELVARNVFSHLEGGTTVAKNDRYITPDEADKVIAELTTPSARLCFALARFAGLRVPSESHLLTWSDVDWNTEDPRLTVRSPKTERHAGHEQRQVPIMPKLMVHLQKAYDDAPEGQTLIVSGCRSNGYLHEHVHAAAKRAGVERWEDIFRLPRASCEREWAMTYPQYAVSKWMGHSIAISGKHYANHVPDEMFRLASHQTAHHTAQQVAVLASTPEQIIGDSGTNQQGSEYARRVGFDPSNHHSAAPACD